MIFYLLPPDKPASPSLTFQAGCARGRAGPFLYLFLLSNSAHSFALDREAASVSYRAACAAYMAPYIL
jgi:hypothetical protein